MSLYTTQKQTHRQKKNQMYGYQRGKWVGRIYEFEINMNQKKPQKQCLIKAYWVYIRHEQIVKIKIKSVKWKVTVCLFCLF